MAEYILSSNTVISSVADIHGNIVSYNHGFKDASGYSDTELQGKPHSILRHPDMPKDAFKDLWQTLQSGKAWFGIVKNRRKNGDYYWVAANANPIIKNGKVTGYLSVRYPASQEQKQSASQLYQKINTGQATFPFTKVDSSFKRLVPSILASTLIVGTLFGMMQLTNLSLVSYILLMIGVLSTLGINVINYRASYISKSIKKGFNDIANGNLAQKIEDNTELGFYLNYIRSSVAETEAMNYDAIRDGVVLSTALNSANTNIMVADSDFNITSINKSLQKMFLDNAEKIQLAMPNFDPKSIVGSSMDSFHKNPAHQRDMVSRLVEPWSTDILISGLTLKLTVVPIINKGQKLGYVVEWLDRTKDVTNINNIIEVLKKIEEGDFGYRVDVQKGDLEQLQITINNTMEKLASVMDAISDVVASQAIGDLTKELPSGKFKGQLHDLKNAINYSSAKVKEVVNVALESSQIVSSAAAEVSTGSIALSQRVQEQAAAIEQTSATMEEMNSQVQSTNENASQANQVVLNVQEKAKQGSDVMTLTIDAMDTIQESSLKIADIVTLMDGIAFQTNLLALNAAVEAARAGDEGRGFAVVAGEVRTLAQKSTEAAKDIKLLIEETVVRVNNGSKLASESGEALMSISHSIDDVVEMIAGIAGASSEQAAGIKQVLTAITQIDGVTQQNAALVEETSAASESLSEQARVLEADMSFFNTGKTARAPQIARLGQNQAKQAAPKAIQPPQINAPVKPQPKNTDNEWGEF